MKVDQLKIVNFQSVELVDIEPGGKSLMLLGKNGVGKSSVISAVFAALTGKTPEKMLQDGKLSGLIEITLGDFVVKGNFNSKKNTWSSFVVETLEGAAYSSTREFLKSKLGTIDFDVNAFLRDSPKKQIELVKKLANIDFTDLDAAYKEFFDERTFINKRVKELEAQQVTFDKELAGRDKVTIIEMNIAYQRAISHNSNVSTCIKAIHDRQTEITELEAKLEIAREKLTKAEEWQKANPALDTQKYIDGINTATETNAAIDRAIAAQAKLEELMNIYEKQDVLNIQLQEIQETKKRVLSTCAMPVPGMTFDEDSLYIDGIPFSQVNTAKRIIAGLQMQLPLMNEVRICGFDASQLDDDSLAKVQAWAKANDLQLFVERVERSQAGLKIEILED